MKFKVKCAVLLLLISSIIVSLFYEEYKTKRTLLKLKQSLRNSKKVINCPRQKNKSMSIFYTTNSALDRIQNCHQYFDVFPSTAYHSVSKYNLCNAVVLD